MVILMSFEAEETAAWLQIAQMFFSRQSHKRTIQCKAIQNCMQFNAKQKSNLTNLQSNAKQYKTVCNSMQKRKAISQT